MEDGGASGASGGGGQGPPWFGRRQSTKRNFSTMSAQHAHSHRDDSPNSLFLSSDPHYHNEHSAPQRRRIDSHPERNHHFPGDGLDFRRPVMSTSSMRHGSDVDGGSDGNGNGSSNNAAVIDLTDENEEFAAEGGEGDTQSTLIGESDGFSSRAAGVQRLPRFGRDVIDVEDQEQGELWYTARDDDDWRSQQLPGANFLALPPGRSVSGRVQYSTLRRPIRPPSPPQEMDDGDIEFIGSRSFAPVQERRPTPGPMGHMDNNIPRSVTPYPPGLNEPIDLTEDADDDVLFVDERRRSGVNLEQPDGNAGHRTHAADYGGPAFGLGRLAHMLREGGAAMGGRLAQRVQDFNRDHAGRHDPARMDLNQLRERRLQLEEQTRAYRERRHQQPVQQRPDGLRGPAERHPRMPVHRPARGRRVHVDADGNIPGYERVGWFSGLPGANPVPRPGPNVHDIGAMMDYGMTGFDLGLGDGGNRPPTPKYSPPPEPEKGFTRHPGEDEVVVCPNCGDELAVSEEEAKQEIWVIKGCGHAYCGDCAQRRSKKESKKGKGRAVDARNAPSPFKHCVVEGCGKSASAKSMVRVYFGS